MLFIAAIFWGLGFIGTRWTFEAFDPLWAHAIRFFISGGIVLPLIIINRKRLHYKEAFIASLFLGGGLILQTYGLNLTTVAKSGFLTTFYVIFTPIILGVVNKVRYPLIFWFSVFLAMVGMAMLCELSIHHLNLGDWLTILCALIFSFHIIYVDKKAKQVDPFLFNALQCLYMGLWGGAVAFIGEGVPAPVEVTSQLVWGFVIVSIFSALIAFTIQVKAQKTIPPHVVGVTFLLESPFAAIFGYWFFNEKLSLLSISGAIVVFLALCLLIWSQRGESS